MNSKEQLLMNSLVRLHTPFLSIHKPTTNSPTHTVVENLTPAAPPAGFAAIEPASFQVSLAASAGAGLTLSKIDYVFDITNPAVLAADITKAQVGRLCAETGTFM